ncbi:WD repeat protein [Aspergillus taichungensis]|uniref:WD repeat protein n=1 Tax=Aspergillus taichungensis TaxID=482145 RepID=A0A2J5HZL2_9EURO|nr:WD repeat protein [Aspergillus taichungensis]
MPLSTGFEPPANPGSCNVPGSSLSRPLDPNTSRQMSHSAHEGTPTSPDDPRLTATAAIAAPPLSAGAGDGEGPLENGIDSTDAGLSALMAVPHYPQLAPPRRTVLSVSELVNAVMEPDTYFRHGDAPSDRAPPPTSSSPPTELYMSDSEMTDVLSDVGGVPLGPYLGDDMGTGGLVHHGTLGFGDAALTDDSDDEGAQGLIMDFDTPVERATPVSVRDDDDSDARVFYGGQEDTDVLGGHVGSPPSGSPVVQPSEVDGDDSYRGFEEEDALAELAEDQGLGDFIADHQFPDMDIHGTIQERNFNIDQFIFQWLVHWSNGTIPSIPHLRTPSPQGPISNIACWSPPEKTVRPPRYRGDFFDLQPIPWWETLRVKRSDARKLRDQGYTSYHNLEYSQHRPGARLPQEEYYFQEKSMHTKCKATIEHFQLRNLMSVPAYNTVHFAHQCKVYSWVPGYDDLTCLIDLSQHHAESALQGRVKISTMKSACDVTIAGGFTGEYALRATGTDGAGVDGYVTQDPNGITNHIDIVPSRTNRSPQGVFASNDRHLRVLDCETNTFVTDHELSRAINCTATSHDGRLRVVIGDSPDAWVIEADTGRPVHPLRGHRDFGFACAWSPDMRHIATSNQDKTAIIWDARMWRALEKIESDVAGYRSLRYSPVGGGPRTLLLSEPADRIAVVNAQTYQTRQVHDFFGEVGGADFSPDGSTIWVANTDEHFGGFMEFERRQWGQRYGQGRRELPCEWAREADLDDDERCVLSERERQLRFLWNWSEEEYEGLLV